MGKIRNYKLRIGAHVFQAQIESNEMSGYEFERDY